MFFALSASALAQSAYTVSQETLDRVACCGLAEPTGSIAFTAVADTPPSVTGTITLRYNLPIANVDAHPAVIADPDLRVFIEATDGGGAPLSPQPTWSVTNDGSNGLVVISVPQGYVYPHTIRVSNVRVNVSGSCGVTDAAVIANASSTGNLLTIGETTSVTLVKGVAQPLKTPTVSPVATINASNGTVTGTPVISISENFLTAFGTTGEYPDDTRSQQTLIRLKVSPIPTGVTITFPGAAGIFGTANSSGVFSGSNVVLNASATSQYVYYVMTDASNPAALDALSFSPTITAAPPYPLQPATITISAAMAPITSLTTPDRFPQFIEGCETGATTFATVSGVLNTILLIPYATTEVGYDTGIAIANTTTDPGTTAMGGFREAIRQNGKITFYFYPKSGPAIDPWVSTSYPGQFGLDAAGLLPTGKTFVALLSQLLPASVDEFSGYIFVVTDFTNAHGEYFISDWYDFAHGALMLVVSDIDRAASGAGRTQEQGLDN